MSHRPRSRRFIRRLRPLTVGALAIADRRANAVGPVKLACEGDTLRIELLAITRLADGFAPVGASRAITFRVPYTAVRGLLREGHTLHLALDPVVAAPHNRFALTRFSRDAAGALMRVFHLRRLLAALSWVMPLPIAALVAWALPAELVAGKLGLGAVALVAAFVSFKLLGRLLDWVSWGGPESDRLRAAFEHTVAARLGLEPAPELAEDPAVLLAPSPAEVALPTLGNMLGTALRPVAFAAAGVLAIAGAALAVSAVKEYGVADIVILPVDDAVSGIGERATATAARARRAGTPERPVCACSRAHAPMWSRGMPQLAILACMRRGTLDSLWLEPGKDYPVALDDPDDEIELDLAVVNNGAEPLDTVDLVVTFARRDERGRRRHLIERGLHWPSELGPGESVKWRVEAPGTELKVDTKLDARLGPGTPPAGAEAFYRLRDARLLEVRVHAAVMLAYVGDERAATLASGLGELDARAERARQAIVETGAPLRLCDVKPSPAGVKACLFNDTGELLRAITVSDAAGERSWTVRDLFAPGKGLSVELPTGADRPAAYRVEGADPRSPDPSIPQSGIVSPGR